MRAIQVTCPHCGARLGVGDGSDVITCEYCGTAARIQRRTRVFERALPPPPQGPNRPIEIAIQTRSRLPLIIVLVCVLLPVAITGFVIWRVVLATKDAVHQVSSMTKAPSQLPSTYVPPEKRPPTWQGTNSVLAADVNGDGALDVLGRGRQVNAGDIIVVLALDGKTGTKLWQSEVIGTYTETYRGPLALSHDLIVFASERGEVQALELAGGKRRWRTQLPERTKHICAGAAGEVLVLGADHKLRSLGATDGVIKHERDAKTCTVLPTDGDERERLTIDTKLQKKLGVYADQLVELGDLRVLGAHKATGTSVTMLVAVDATSTERWRMNVSPDPLASTGTPRHLAGSAHEVCAIYYPGGSDGKVACFKVADGSRLWEHPVPSFVSGLVARGGTLFVTSHRGIEARDITSGALRWQLTH